MSAYLSCGKKEQTHSWNCSYTSNCILSSPNFWCDAAQTVVYLINRLPSFVLWKTTYKALFGYAPSYSSKKLVGIAKSSAEAEYRVVAHGCCELLWQRIMLELGFKQSGPMCIYSNSASVIKLANNLVYHEKTKHVEVDFHFIRKKIEKRMWYRYKFLRKINSQIFSPRK